MQKPMSLAGQCAKGHDVYVTRDLNGDINGGTVGVELIKPLPDGKSSEPIVVACNECSKVIADLLRSES